MFYLFKNNKLVSYSNSEIIQDGIKSQKLDFTDLEIEKLQKGCLYENGKITETPEFLTEIQQEEVNKIEKEFQNSINQFTAGISQAEIDTWNTKVVEAQKVIAGQSSDLLNSILIDGETAEDLAQNILIKASEYSAIYCEAEKIKRTKLKNLGNKQ